MPPEIYIHGSEPKEQERLEIQHRLLGGASFLPVLQSDWRVLDVGSGTGAVAREIAPKVFPGEVIGIDSQKEQVNAAMRFARDEKISNVKFQAGSALSLEFSDGSFDLVYCRFLLEHISNPLSVLREMARVAKPGGTIIACECKVGCCSTTEPPISSARKALDALYQLQSQRGGDPYIGDKLESLFREAGLKDVHADILTTKLDSAEDIRQYAFGGSHMLEVSERDIIGAGLLSKDEMDLAYEEWDRLGRTPGAVAWFKLCRAQGTKTRRKPLRPQRKKMQRSSVNHNP